LRNANGKALKAVLKRCYCDKMLEEMVDSYAKSGAGTGAGDSFSDELPTEIPWATHPSRARQLQEDAKRQQKVRRQLRESQKGGNSAMGFIEGGAVGGVSAESAGKLLQEAVQRLEEENTRISDELQERKRTFEQRKRPAAAAGQGKESGRKQLHEEGIKPGLRQRKAGSQAAAGDDTPVLFKQLARGKSERWSSPPRRPNGGQREGVQDVQFVFNKKGPLGFDFSGPHPENIEGGEKRAVVRNVSGQAENAGLEVGDVIVAVGSSRVEGRSHTEIVTMLTTSKRPCTLSIERKRKGAKWLEMGPGRSPVLVDDESHEALDGGREADYSSHAIHPRVHAVKSAVQHLPFSPSGPDTSITSDYSLPDLPTPQHAQQQEKRKEKADFAKLLSGIHQAKTKEKAEEKESKQQQEKARVPKIEEGEKKEEGGGEEEEKEELREDAGRPSLDNNRGGSEGSIAQPPPPMPPAVKVQETPIVPPPPPPPRAPLRASAAAPPKLAAPPPFTAASRRSSWSVSSLKFGQPEQPKQEEQDLVFSNAGPFGFEFSGEGRVRAVTPGGQASAVGMALDDMIQAVDGVHTADFSHEEIIELLQGRERPRTIRVARAGGR
jgi:hypothetical protein